MKRILVCLLAWAASSLAWAQGVTDTQVTLGQ